MSDNSIGTPSGLRPLVVHSLIDHLFVSLFYHNYNNNLLTLYS
nr:MAG TPA_asm: hypothetical protein [Caudoviricetes sp.]